MSDAMPDHESLEKWVKDQPLDVIQKLPDNVERHRAEDHIKLAYDYAKISREKRPDR